MPYVLKTPLDNNALTFLEIDKNEFETLSIAEKITRIRKQYKKLSVKYHPDKNNGHRSLFEQLKDAYESLLSIEDIQNDLYELIKPHISSDYTTQSLSLNTFNLIMEGEIERMTIELEREYSTLSLQKDKEKFAEQYANFLHLSQLLNAQKEQLQQHRIALFFKQNDVHTQHQLYTNYIFEWRKQIIILLGEEYLDDFQYREALAFGDLWPILDPIKLKSPLKWLFVLLSSIALFLSHLINDLPYLIFGDRQIPAQAEIQFQILLIDVLMFLMPLSVVTIILGATFIQQCLLTLACPCNRIIRPLHEMFPTYSETQIIQGMTCLTLAAIALLFFSIITLPTGVLFSLCEISVQLWSLYQSYTFLKTYRDLGGEMHPLILLMFLISALYNLLDLYGASSILWLFIRAPLLHIPLPKVQIFWDALFFSLIMNCDMSFNIQRLQNPSRFSGEQTEQLPLPDQKTPDIIKEACSQANLPATQSHYFFRTQKDALPKNTQKRSPFSNTSDEVSPLMIAS